MIDDINILQSDFFRLNSILNAMLDGVYIVSKEYDIQYINPVLKSEFGEVNNRECYEYFHGRSTPCPWCKNAEVFAGESISWDWYSPKNNKHYELFDTPLVNSDGTVSKLEILRDVTKIKEAENILQKSQLDLEDRVKDRTAELDKTHKMLLHSEKLSIVGTLAASLAHEFNNPLQSVFTILKSVNKRCEFDGDDKELMQLAVDECYRMRDLINDMQNFNRPTSDKKVSIDVHKLLNNILILLKKEYLKHNIIVETNYIDNMPLLIAVHDQIKQVLLNIFKNAIDASPEKGGVVKIKTMFTSEMILISISDSGDGIKLKDQKKIFEPFFSTKLNENGTGLGLSVSNGIIKDHGGQIKVHSKLKKGTTFIISLPINTNGVEDEN